jgi:proteasome assembly chaperone (PAC2) family protein
MSLPSHIVVQIFEIPNLRHRSLVCGFLGSGYVGKLAVDQMIDKLKAIPFINIFSSSFHPHVLIQSNGTDGLMKNTLEVETICTLAAYITGIFSKTPKVYGTSTAPQIIKEFQKYDVSIMNSGSITRMNGLIIGVGKRKGINKICLLGETFGCVIDAKSSQVVLEILKILVLKLDLVGISEKPKMQNDLSKQARNKWVRE